MHWINYNIDIKKNQQQKFSKEKTQKNIAKKKYIT